MVECGNLADLLDHQLPPLPAAKPSKQSRAVRSSVSQEHYLLARAPGSLKQQLQQFSVDRYLAPSK
eukprot:16505-Heterococcus_DN1.PRE.1